MRALNAAVQSHGGCDAVTKGPRVVASGCDSSRLLSTQSLDSCQRISTTGEELDVRALHAAVQAHGGYDAVTKGRLWSRIGTDLSIPLDYQNAGTVLRCRTLCLFVDFLWYAKLRH